MIVSMGRRNVPMPQRRRFDRIREIA